MMKKVMVVLAAVLAAAAVRAEEFAGEAVDFPRYYVEAAATTVLPQGGARMPRRSGAALRAGRYFAEFWAVEGEVAWLEDRVGLSAKALWHWWGYERFDPFFTFGAKGWLNDGAVGPAGGFGAFYHVTENWSVRVDADAALGVDGDVGVFYSLAVGAHLSF